MKTIKQKIYSERDNNILKIGFILMISVLAIFIFWSETAFALDYLDKNITDTEKAKVCLNYSQNIVEKMEKEEFSINRVNDSFTEASTLYSAQLILKEKNKSVDFSSIFYSCQEIEDTYKKAINAKDQITALKKFYNLSLEGVANKSSVDKIMGNIEIEMKNERYEQITPLIDKAYEEIALVKSAQTTLNLFYESTTKGVKKFFTRNWKTMGSVLLLIILLFLICRIKISKWLIMKKIRKLELRKSTLKGLIMSVQKQYFTHGAISEGMYNIKTKKFAELMRDIDRQIPLLREELAKLERKKK